MRMAIGFGAACAEAVVGISKVPAEARAPTFKNSLRSIVIRIGLRNWTQPHADHRGDRMVRPPASPWIPALLNSETQSIITKSSSPSREEPARRQLRW